MSMGSQAPIYYTADAACWCPRHAEEAYPGCTDPERTVRDREGNPVHPVWSYQGAAHGDTCDVDGEPLFPPDESTLELCTCDYCFEVRLSRRRVYLVEVAVAGSITVEVAAESPERASERARATSGFYSDLQATYGGKVTTISFHAGGTVGHVEELHPADPEEDDEDE